VSAERPVRHARTSREVVMDRIKAALSDRPDPAPIPRDYRSDARPGTDVVGLFAETCADYKATVERVDEAGLPAAVAAALAGRGATRIAVPAGVPEAWLGETAEVERIGDDPPLGVAELDALDGVLTGCAVAIAETGTIVLDAGPDQGRRALTLLPDYHLCVVRADQVVATVAQALERLEPGRPQTWISGPSATSDIELNRVEGVHGPRTLHVLVVG
jgi:L-lactate dehydrogenase complex protein LldG